LDYLSSANVVPSSRLASMAGKAKVNWDNLVNSDRWSSTHAELNALLN
jgi:hypothetical protein